MSEATSRVEGRRSRRFTSTLVATCLIGVRTKRNGCNAEPAPRASADALEQGYEAHGEQLTRRERPLRALLDKD